MNTHPNIKDLLQLNFDALRHQTYTLLGDPIPWQRARVHNKHFWDPQKQQKLVSQIEVQRQHKGPLFSGPLCLEVLFSMRMPGRLSMIKKKEIEGRYHIFRPDTDNMIKYICDMASNGILFEDDAIICMTKAVKVYGLEPKTEFIIYELKG